MPFSLEHVVDQHAEETAILWARRVHLAGEPHVSLNALAGVDAQLVAHLEGLRLAKDAGREAAWREFEDWPQPAEAFAVAARALASDDAADWKRALDAAIAKPCLARALASALGWSPLAAARDRIDELLADSRAVAQEIGARAAGMHRDDADGRLWKLLSNQSPPQATIRVCRAAAEMGRLDLASRLASLAAEASNEVQYAATCAAAALGDGASLAKLATMYEPAIGRRDHALRVLAGGLSIDRAGEWLQELYAAGGVHHRRAAIAAAGILGDPAHVPWLIERLRDLPLARLAGDAIATICGIHLGIERLERPWPEEFAAGPNDDPGDEDVSLDLDENRLWPDPQRVDEWWRQHGARFPAGVRHIAGQAHDDPWLGQVLRRGMQTQRATAAQELALRQRGTEQFDVRAPGWRQLAALEMGVG